MGVPYRWGSTFMVWRLAEERQHDSRWATSQEGSSISVPSVTIPQCIPLVLRGIFVHIQETNHMLAHTVSIAQLHNIILIVTSASTLARWLFKTSMISFTVNLQELVLWLSGTGTDFDSLSKYLVSNCFVFPLLKKENNFKQLKNSTRMLDWKSVKKK